MPVSTTDIRKCGLAVTEAHTRRQLRIELHAPAQLCGPQQGRVCVNPHFITLHAHHAHLGSTASQAVELLRCGGQRRAEEGTRDQ
ncbi:hypothetical protein HaLaN_12294 [Haematococcus lacustris]|uniref:Uncharacterized protein n=1 Tax=Haematococcus lacustris TaxID=44745 RepID=A0A699Z9Q1_HAELA|nr:hypothetical protein HaLaN_12294 [Haematococcus lacustris]